MSGSNIGIENILDTEESKGYWNMEGKLWRLVLALMCLVSMANARYFRTIEATDAEENAQGYPNLRQAMWLANVESTEGRNASPTAEEVSRKLDTHLLALREAQIKKQALHSPRFSKQRVRQRSQVSPEAMKAMLDTFIPRMSSRREDELLDLHSSDES